MSRRPVDKVVLFQQRVNRMLVQDIRARQRRRIAGHHNVGLAECLRGQHLYTDRKGDQKDVRTQRISYSLRLLSI